MHQTLTFPSEHSLSPDILSVREELLDGRLKRLGKFKLGDLEAEVCESRTAVWCLVRRQGKGGIALRAAHLHGVAFKCRKAGTSGSEALKLEIESSVGRHIVCFSATGAGLHRLRMTTRFTPTASMRLSYLPRDVYALDPNDDPAGAKGNV